MSECLGFYFFQYLFETMRIRESLKHTNNKFNVHYKL